MNTETTTTIEAPDLNAVVERATQHFNAFYGERPWRMTTVVAYPAATSIGSTTPDLWSAEVIADLVDEDAA